MTDLIFHTIFQNLIDRLSTIPKKHFDVVVAQLETTKSEINELFLKSSLPTKVSNVSKVKKEKKVPSKKKDENAVKKPLSSYMLFCKDHRSVITAEKVEPKNVLKKLGEAWKALSDDEKTVYTEKAAEDKRRYEEETGVKEDSKSKKNTKSKNDNSKSDDSDPIDVTEKKKSLSPYIRFCNEKRSSVKESHPEMDGKTIIKTLGAMWRALSEHEQQSYKM
jgi:hypothetical protein